MKLAIGDSIDVIDEGARARVRVRESMPLSIKASAHLTADELEAHALECLRLADIIRTRKSSH